MALVLADRVKETTTSIGTGAVTLAGAVSGFQSFAVVGNANTTYYTIVLGSQWEVGIGTYTASGTTLSRDTVLESSNANALVPFAAGIKDVFVTYPADKAISDGYGTLPVANGGTGATNATDARTNLVAAKSGANSDITSMSGITGGISLVDNLDFDTTSVVVGAVGRLVWNEGDGTLDLGLKGGNVTLQVGQEEVQRSFNAAGVAIVEGNVVYVSGAQGNRIAVSIAQANIAATSTGTIGMATENLAIGAEGFITTQGLVRKLNTILDSEGNALTEGDLLYLSATVLGGYTKIEPDTPDFHVFIGYVVRVHATTGSIFIRPNVYPSLDEINGIKIVSTASGNTLIYDAVAGYYKTNTLTAGTNVSITNGAGAITINATDQFVGTVTSVGGTGTVNGITLTGTVTSTGDLTLGGTLSGVSLTTQVSGTLPVGNGGTGATTLTANNVLLGNGTSAVQVVAPGTTGNVLTSNGTTWASTAPAGGGSLILLQSVVASGSATVTLNAFSSTYDNYIIYVDDCIPVTNATDLRMRVNGKTADYSWVYQSLISTSTTQTNAFANTTGTFLPINLSVSNGLKGGAIVDIVGRAHSAPMIVWRSTFYSSGRRFVLGSGGHEDILNLSSVTFLMSSGNISAGNFRLYGIKKS